MTTLEQIQARMKKLQAQAEAIVAKGTQAAVDQIRELMLKHGLTTADIEATAKAKRDAGANGRSAVGRGVKATMGSKGKLPAKYLNPKTGETWSGHARPPAWIKDVKDRTKFLIDSADTTSPAKKASGSGGNTSGSKVQSKRALPAKYQDPKSGATWSGRGPAPKWLASAKDRTKFLVEQAPAAKSDASATRMPKKPKTTSTVGAASKRVGVKKAVASKKAAAGTKKAVTKASASTAATAKKTSTRKTGARKVSPPAAPARAMPEAASTESL
jgi:DNA-binding protein H-NS